MVKKSTVVAIIGVAAAVPVIYWVASPIMAEATIKSNLDKAMTDRFIGSPFRLAAPGTIYEGLEIVARNPDINAEIYAQRDANGQIRAWTTWLLRAYMPPQQFNGFGEYNIETFPPGDRIMNNHLKKFKTKVQQHKDAGFPADLLDRQLAWMNEIAPQVADLAGQG